MNRKQKVLLRIFILFFVIVLSLIGFWVFYLKSPSLIINAGLSKETVGRIAEVVDKSPLIEGIIIVDVDLQRNMRHSVYVMIKDKDIQEMYDKFSNGAISVEVPFFTGEYVNDRRLIRVMNQEFVCGPFKDTVAYKYAPMAANKIKIVCAVSIPPSFGKFKGIVGIYLKEDPTEIQKDQIRIYIKNISEDVARELK